VHGGARAAGAFIQTLVLIDVATGWTERVPVVARSALLVIEANAAIAASGGRTRSRAVPF